MIHVNSLSPSTLYTSMGQFHRYAARSRIIRNATEATENATNWTSGSMSRPPSSANSNDCHKQHQVLRPAALRRPLTPVQRRIRVSSLPASGPVAAGNGTQTSGYKPLRRPTSSLGDAAAAAAPKNAREVVWMANLPSRR